MPAENRVSIKGSEKKPITNAQLVGPVPAGETVSVTVVLRRRGDHPAIAVDSDSYRPHVREDYGITHGADPNDLKAMERFAHEHI